MSSGAAEVLLTDVPKMQRLLRYNVEANAEATPKQSWVHSDVLDWTQPFPMDSRARVGPWDVVLAADVVYDEACFEPLWATLMKVAGQQTQILLALPARVEEEAQGCLLNSFLARANGRFEWRVVERRAYEPHQSVVHVLEMKRVVTQDLLKDMREKAMQDNGLRIKSKAKGGAGSVSVERLS